jgi:hypothetical protein
MLWLAALPLQGIASLSDPPWFTCVAIAAVISLLQVPQFLLEDAVLSGAGSSCSVIVTQPRRIAAISVADRVAVERGERGGLAIRLLYLYDFAYQS